MKKIVMATGTRDPEIKNCDFGKYFATEAIYGSLCFETTIFTTIRFRVL